MKKATDTYTPHLFSKGSINALVITGILSFLMHPFVVFGYHFPDMGFLVWFYLIPLIIGIHRHKFTHKFILCFLAGMITHYGTLYWLMTAMQKFGGLNFFQSFGVMSLLCILLSLLFALFLSLASWVNHMIKIPILILLPVFMVTRDWLLHHIPFSGFPWIIPPYALGEWLHFFQWIDHTGTFGLSFFIYLINGLFAGGFLLFIHRKQLDKMIARFVVIVVLMVASLFASFLSNQQYEKSKTTIKNINIALIQGNIPQDIKWDPYHAQDILNKYFRFSHKAIKDGAHLVIWPETAYPFGLKYPKLLTESFLNKERLMTPILMGAFISKEHNNQLHLYNSVIHVDTHAKIAEFYSKMHLVPFGEYLPLKDLLSFIPTITRAVGELSPGTEYKVFQLLGLKIGSLICFEDIFPKYAKKAAEQSADLLVNYTNDAWYGDSSAQYQHVVFSQFRALENRRNLLRATNTGLTAIINPRGEIFDKLEPFKESYLMHNIKIDKASSFYTTHGDDWVSVIILFFCVFFLYASIKRLLGPVKINF